MSEPRGHPQHDMALRALTRRHFLQTSLHGIGGVALASGAVGVASNASGYTEIGKGFQDVSGGVSKGARSLVEFSGEPLSVTDDVIVGKPAQPLPQPAPRVPYAPGQE